MIASDCVNAMLFLILLFFVVMSILCYRKIKTSQGDIFTAPMASGGELTDLILRYLVFWFVFRSRSFEEGISMAFDGSENPQKGPQSAQVSVPPSKVGRGRIGMPGNFRVLKVRIAEVAE